MLDNFRSKERKYTALLLSKRKQRTLIVKSDDKLKHDEEYTHHSLVCFFKHCDVTKDPLSLLVGTRKSS